MERTHPTAPARRRPSPAARALAIAASTTALAFLAAWALGTIAPLWSLSGLVAASAVAGVALAGGGRPTEPRP